MLLSLAGGGAPYVPKKNEVTKRGASNATLHQQSKIPPPKITYFYSRRNAAGMATPINQRNQQNSGRTARSDVVQAAKWIKQVPQHAHHISNREGSIATKENSDTRVKDVKLSVSRSGSPHYAGKHSELGPPHPLRQIGNTDIILHEETNLRKSTPHHASVFSIPDLLRPEEEEDEREKIRRAARRASNEILVAAAAHTAAARRAYSPQSKIKTSVHSRNTNDDISENKSGISSTKSTIKKKKKKKKSRKKMAGAQQPKKKPKVPVEELRLGGQVEVEARGKVQFAVVRYIGPTHFLQGVTWIGLELSKPTGLNDGGVEGVRYFKCQDKYGVFVRLDAVLRVVGDDFWVGSRVSVKRAPGRILTGTVQYIGPADFADGEWVGVALDHPDNGNDGKVGLRRYFKCADQCGVFSRRWRIECLKEGSSVDDNDLHAQQQQQQQPVGSEAETQHIEEAATEHAEAGALPATVVKRSTPQTVVKARASSPLQFEFSDENDPMGLHSDQDEHPGAGAAEPVQEELVPAETHRREPASRRGSDRPGHRRRRTPTPAHSSPRSEGRPQQHQPQYQPYPGTPVAEEDFSSDQESPAPVRFRNSAARTSSSYSRRPELPPDPSYHHHSDSQYLEPHPSEHRRLSPTPRSLRRESLDTHGYSGSMGSTPAPRTRPRRTPRVDEEAVDGSANTSMRGGSHFTPRRAKPKTPTGRLKSEHARRYKTAPRSNSSQKLRRARTPSPRRGRAQFPMEHPRTILRTTTTTTTNNTTEKIPRQRSTSVTGRTLPWEKPSRAITPMKGRRRVARSMSPGVERRVHRLSNSKQSTPAHGRELPWSPHPSSRKSARAQTPALSSAEKKKMRIKDVREAREKAEQQLRERAEHEAKWRSERETREQCERLAEEARQNDTVLRMAKEKDEKKKRMKKEKALLKARSQAQKVALTVRKAREQAAQEEQDERERQQWVLREASAKKAREQAEKAEKKARADAKRLEEQLRQAQEAVKRWEHAEAERQAREERERQETSAQKQRRLERLALQAKRLAMQAEKDGIIVDESPAHDYRGTLSARKHQSPYSRDGSPARELVYGAAGILNDEADDIGQITVQFTPNKEHVVSRQWKSTTAKRKVDPGAQINAPESTPPCSTPSRATSPAKKSARSQQVPREVPVIDSEPAATPTKSTSENERRRCDMVSRLQHARDSRLIQLQRQLEMLTRSFPLQLTDKARDEQWHHASSVSLLTPSQRLSLVDIHDRQNEIRQQLSEF